MAPKSPLMSDIAAPWVISEGLAGLRAQALGLAEAAGLTPELRELKPTAPWKWVAAKFWPNPLAAVAEAVKAPLPSLAIGCGGMAGAVLAALRRQSMHVVQVQNPRMNIGCFDFIVANRHDELTGPNVFVTRTALHRVTPERLALEAELWRDRLSAYRRPLVAVLLGGSNGRYHLDSKTGSRLAADLAKMAQRDKIGVVVTPSRRTDPSVTALIRAALAPTGGWVWDFEGENPYFGMLAQRVAAQEREHLLKRQWRRIWRSLTSDRGVWASACCSHGSVQSPLPHSVLRFSCPRVELTPVWSVCSDAASADSAASIAHAALRL